MADRLNGYRILILETREEAQFSRLLTEQGADVLQCPMFTIHDAPDPAPVEAWIVRAIERQLDDMVLLTGEGLRRLMKVVRLIGVEEPFVASLGKARKFARGPKPGKALREIGLEPQMTTEKPTSEGVAEMLSRLDLDGHRLGLEVALGGLLAGCTGLARLGGLCTRLRRGLRRTRGRLRRSGGRLAGRGRCRRLRRARGGRGVTALGGLRRRGGARRRRLRGRGRGACRGDPTAAVGRVVDHDGHAGLGEGAQQLLRLAGVDPRVFDGGGHLR